jgi:hypothetical protein
MNNIMKDELGAPKIADRGTFQAEVDALRVQEKAHMRAGDAIGRVRGTPDAHHLLFHVARRQTRSGAM